MKNGEKADEGEIKRNKGVRHALPRWIASFGYIGGDSRVESALWNLCWASLSARESDDGDSRAYNAGRSQNSGR